MNPRISQKPDISMAMQNTTTVETTRTHCELVSRGSFPDSFSVAVEFLWLIPLSKAKGFGSKELLMLSADPSTDDTILFLG